VITRIDANATPTFGIFLKGNCAVPFDSAMNRIFVRFRDGGGLINARPTSIGGKDAVN
jgi:hypothetical protein